MNDETEKMFSDLVAKGRHAQMSMWSATGTAFGFIVSASSVIAAFKKEASGVLVYPLIVVCFCGIASVLGCYLAQKKEYVRQITELPEIQRMTTEQKLEKLQATIRAPNPVQRLERTSLTLLWIAMLLFLALAIVCFRAPNP